MKTELAIALSDHVRKNRDRYKNRSGTLKEQAAQVSKEVGFDVKPGQWRDVLRANNFETRRIPERDRQRMLLLAENERLNSENNNLRHIVAKVAASDYLPDDLKEYILSTLPDEMKKALTPCPDAC